MARKISEANNMRKFPTLLAGETMRLDSSQDIQRTHAMMLELSPRKLRTGARAAY
jgi:hypothetical protein